MTVATREGFSCSSAVFSPDNVWIIAAVNHEFQHHQIVIHVTPGWTKSSSRKAANQWKSLTSPAGRRSSMR